MDVAVEHLGKTLHKRPSNLHIVVVPCLMTGQWRHHKTQECGCYFHKPIGSTLWGKTQYKLVLIFVCLPIMVHRPSFSAKHKLLEDFRGAMLQDNSWKTSDERGVGFFAQISTASVVLLPLVTAAGVGVVMNRWTFLTFPNRRQSMTIASINGKLGTNCDFWKDEMVTIQSFRSNVICVIFVIFCGEDLFRQVLKTVSSWL